MVFHEIPEEIITWLLLKETGLSEKKSLLYAFLAAALSTPLGTIVAYPFISSLEELQLAMLLGISAGALIYVVASRLLPEGEKGLKKHSLFALAIGMLIAIVIIMGHAVV
jgi:zinc and cadmium transporter